MAVVLILYLNFTLFEDIFFSHCGEWGNEALEMIGQVAVMDCFKTPSPYFLGEREEIHEKIVGIVSLWT
jgi:hypothetical protein